MDCIGIKMIFPSSTDSEAEAYQNRHLRLKIAVNIPEVS